MSDTATEATEAPAEKPDYEAILSEAFVTISNAAGADGSLTPEQVAELQEVYRSVPAAARGKVQGTALKAVIVGGNADAVEAIIDACMNLPRATGTARVAKHVDPKVALTIQAAAALVAFADLTSDAEIGAEVSATASAWYKEGTPDEHKEAVLKVAANMVKASARKGGGSGARKTFTEALSDLISRGDLKTPANLTCAGVEGTAAKVLKDGTVKVEDESFPNLTAAAKAIKGGEKSINGWGFFLYEGKPVGDLRQN